MVKRIALSPSEKMEWEKLVQLACLKGISSQSFSIDELVFHGGTSLRFSWGSPRFSEDLDFMVAKKKSASLGSLVGSAFKNMERELQKLDPNFIVRIKEKSRRDGQLQTYMIVLEKKDVVGSAQVKLEFWEVSDTFLNSYGTKEKIPRDRFAETRIFSESALPVAELRSAYCDKLVALSTRPFLKWRDIFDIWWLRTQNNLDPLKEKDFLEFFQHNLSAYSLPENMTLKQSLCRYLNWDRNDILKKSEEDLQKWLSEDLWKKLYPKTVTEMIELVEQDVQSLLDLLTPKNDISSRSPKP